MSLTPQQITTFLKQSGFTSPRATQKKKPPGSTRTTSLLMST